MARLRGLISSVLIVSLLAPLFQVVRANFVSVPTTTIEETGLQFRLSHGVEQPEVIPATKPASASELSQTEIEEIVKRLPAMTVDPSSGIKEFSMRERSIPPPRTGNTIETSFPAPPTAAVAPTTNAGPLEVLRYSPEGNVPIAPDLTVTFSQPMVALSSQEETATNVPVKLTPQPSGKWRWLGTQTLAFQPEGRFPMATTYTVTVPAGTRATNGGTLAAEKSWSFSTSPLTVKTSYPAKDSTQPRDSLMFIEFDQRIDPAAVLPSIRVTGGNRILKTRLATSDEVKQAMAQDWNATAALREAAKDRSIAFRAIDAQTGSPDRALPIAARIEVSVVSGAPSAEGPNKTAKPFGFDFSTYGPLKVAEHGCNGERRCSPYDIFEIEFSNELSEVDHSKIRIEPALDEMEIATYGSNVSIDGVKRGDTIYRVTFDKSLKDKFNQTLGRDLTLTFSVGPNPRRFVGPPNDFVVMDPASPTRCSVFSVNFARLNVRLYSVTPNDWPQWAEYKRDVKPRPSIPGRLVFSKTIAVRNSPNNIVETVVDLRPALTNGHGQMILVVEPSGGRATDEDDDGISESWIQVTDIGLDAFVDSTEAVGWVTSLKDGTPLRDVDVTLLPSDITARSGADGLARLGFKPMSSTLSSLLVARRDGDVAILPENLSYWSYQSGSWFKKEQADSLHWFVFDDRKMYRPGEEIHVKGWIRKLGGGKTGDVGPVPNTVTHVTYILSDSRGNQMKVGSVPLNAFGGFDWSLKLPDKMNLGNATLRLQALSPLVGNTHQHAFQVQEFRRPEFEVKAQNESEGPFFVGGGADVSLSASYFAGGGLATAPVTWDVSATVTQFTPPNRDDYIFGEWMPPWSRSKDYRRTTKQTLSGVTDADGKHRLHIDFDRINPARPSTITASASVTDVNRQRWASETTLLVHPANLYVGLKSDRSFVPQGEPVAVKAIVTDLDGKLVEGREIKMVATRLGWRQEEGGGWARFETDPQECSIRSSNSAVTCTFQTKTGGDYTVRATVQDDLERRNESELDVTVSGERLPSGMELDQGTVEVVPDRKEYKAGDTAEILVQAPFYPAEGVMSVRRSGIVKVERFRMDQQTTTLRLPIEQSWAPNIHLQVDLLGEVERDDTNAKPGAKPPPKQPAFATGNVKISVPAIDRRLSITATPRDKALEPGGETSVSVDVKDAAGAPVSGGEIAVVVVDEAVLALTGYKLDDPISVFYPERGDDVQDVHLRDKIWLSLTRPEDGNTGGGPAGGSGGLSMDAPAAKQIRGLLMGRVVYPVNSPPGLSMGGAAEPIRVRQDFNALAVFAPSVPTDVNGRAEVKVKLPDNLTRYRVMAVAVAGGKQFGYGESSITARMPLMVRASAPRFLNFGDAFEFPVVVQNQTDAAMSVDVTLRGTNARFSGAAGSSSTPALAGRRVTVPANDRVEVRIPISTASAGKARFQVAAVSGRWSDAAEVALPVWTPATTEAFATYGEIDQGAISQAVKAPSGVFKEFGGLEIEASSTQLQQLTDAFLYLQSYPYECSEQLSSRILSVAALKDVLRAFNTKDLPTPVEIEAAVSRDIRRLSGMQNDDGGFGFWKRGEESWPYLSIHVAHALARAQGKGFPVPFTMRERSLGYLRNIESRIPSRYGRDAKRALIAYALYVEAQMGDRDTRKARKLLSGVRVEELSLETIGWLLYVLSGDEGSRNEVEALRQNLKNRVTETAATAHFVSSYADDDHLVLNSDRRADAVVLDALIADQPANDLIPKIVRGLLAHRVQGRWSNTQDNVFVLLALDRYFRTYEKVTPDFVARVWLGNAYAGAHAFKGRTVERQKVDVPMRYLSDSDSLIISKEGEGRLYYRLAMSYAPVNSVLSSADYGFTVERSYEAVDRAEDVQRDADGGWRIKAGARVRVRMTMTAPSRRYHVALVDYLPAGFESLNPELATTEVVPEDQKDSSSGSSWWLWRRVWFDHQNLRDERSEAFAALLWGGVYRYTYVARATTPGTFVVPPAKAEEMYHPETFGRSKSDRVRIE